MDKSNLSFHPLFIISSQILQTESSRNKYSVSDYYKYFRVINVPFISSDQMASVFSKLFTSCIVIASTPKKVSKQS
jgi:hypothetical protein